MRRGQQLRYELPSFARQIPAERDEEAIVGLCESGSPPEDSRHARRPPVVGGQREIPGSEPFTEIPQEAERLRRGPNRVTPLVEERRNRQTPLACREVHELPEPHRPGATHGRSGVSTLHDRQVQEGSRQTLSLDFRFDEGAIPLHPIEVDLKIAGTLARPVADPKPNTLLQPSVASHRGTDDRIDFGYGFGYGFGRRGWRQHRLRIVGVPYRRCVDQRHRLNRARCGWHRNLTARDPGGQSGYRRRPWSVQSPDHAALKDSRRRLSDG